MDEKEIIDMIISGYPWEQIIYKIVCTEALDPWDLDICKLSDVFLKYITKLKILDFKIPAHYLLIAAILLKMKSEHLYFIDFVENESEIEDIDEKESIEMEDKFESGEMGFKFTTIHLHPKRVPKRKIVFEELIISLKKALKTEERRTWRRMHIRSTVKIRKEDITKRINDVYKKIDTLLIKLKKNELKFSNLVEKWEKNNILNTFMPLIYLDHEKKIDCRQERVFDEIFIKKLT